MKSLRCILGLALLPVLAPAADRPNILFVAVDDLRPEFGAYGASHVKSPNLDRLARAGITFNRAYCQQAVCSPTRSSLMTGTRPDTTKVWDLVTHFRTALPDVVTLGQHFKNNGYFVQGMGKIYHGGFDDPATWSVAWQRSTRVPLLIAPPRSGATASFPRGATCADPVGLIDLYPTLVDVCGIATRPGLAGESLVPRLKNPATASDRHIITSFDAGNFSVTGARWRYLRYADGNEELYDSVNDPHEWTNLAGRPEHRATQQAMAAKIPAVTASTTDASAPPAKSGRKKKNAAP